MLGFSPLCRNTLMGLSYFFLDALLKQKWIYLSLKLSTFSLLCRFEDLHHARDALGQRAPGLPDQGLPSAGQGRDLAHAAATERHLSELEDLHSSLLGAAQIYGACSHLGPDHKVSLSYYTNKVSKGMIPTRCISCFKWAIPGLYFMWKNVHMVLGFEPTTLRTWVASP